jgi:hypothetical protein
MKEYLSFPPGARVLLIRNENLWNLWKAVVNRIPWAKPFTSVGIEMRNAAVGIYADPTRLSFKQRI